MYGRAEKGGEGRRKDERVEVEKASTIDVMTYIHVMNIYVTTTERVGPNPVS